MTFKVGKYDIEAKDTLTWYDSKELEACMLGGAKMGMEGDTPKLTGIEGDILFKAKLKLFELVILKITEGEKSIPFSINWLKTLTQAEGNLLDETLDALYKTQKKT